MAQPEDRKALLEAFLDQQREFLIKKVSEASEADQRKRLVPSETTLLGLVKHLAYVERWWFQDRFAGQSASYPWTDEDMDADFRVEEGETTEAILDLYRAECEKSRAITASASLDDRSQHGTKSRGPQSLLWILLHMIEETARHNGHADILREQMDGTTGN